MTLLPFIITGLVSGSVFGLAAVGLVLSYKTSGIFNFAYGAIAAAGAYAFYELTERRGLPWQIAAPLVLLVFAPFVGLVLERLSAGLRGARPVYQIVATVGVLLTFQGLSALLYGTETLPLQPFLPQNTFDVAGTFVSAEQIVTVLFSLIGLTALLVLFRRTRVGTQMRAVVDNAELLSLQGDDPTAVRRFASIIGSVFACATGMLVAPNLGLNTLVLALLVVQAFGAAAVGRFGSIGATYVGGLVIGVLAALSTKYAAQWFPDSAYLSGIPSALPFLVLFCLLAALPASRFFDVPSAGRRLAMPTSGRSPLPSAAALIAVALAVPLVVGADLPAWTSAVCLSVTLLGLALLLWTSGQVSLAHAAFAAIGAATMSQLLDAGLPWGLALATASLLAVPVAAALALPTLRLSGLYLALATFGFGILMQNLVYSTDLMFGEGLRAVRRPDVDILGASLASDRGYFYVCAAMAAAAGLGVFMLQRARLGTLLRAYADSPTSVTANGGDTRTLRILVFCLAAALAAAGGALASGVTLQASSRSYGYDVSLTWVAVMALLGARASTTRAAAAGLALVVLPTTVSLSPSAYTLIFGLAAVLCSLLADRGLFGTRLLPSTLTRRRDRLASTGRLARRPVLTGGPT